MAQVIHDSHVHIHPDAPQAIKDARGNPTRADYEAAMRIYESPEIRRDLAETNMPDGSDWLTSVRREAMTDALDGAIEAIGERRYVSGPMYGDEVVGMLRARAADLREGKSG